MCIVSAEHQQLCGESVWVCFPLLHKDVSFFSVMSLFLSLPCCQSQTLLSHWQLLFTHNIRNVDKPKVVLLQDVFLTLLLNKLATLWASCRTVHTVYCKKHIWIKQSLTKNFCVHNISQGVIWAVNMTFWSVHMLFLTLVTNGGPIVIYDSECEGIDFWIDLQSHLMERTGSC